MIPDQVDAFFRYARERYNIMLRRDAGEPKPWTMDPILLNYRFCNVFREDDTTTKWIREHLTEPSYRDSLLGSLVIARWFNRVETLEKMLPADDCKTPYFIDNLLYNWGGSAQPFWADRMRERLKDVKPLVTGAYMIKTPAGMNKLDGLLNCLEKILPDCYHLQSHIEPETTLEGVCEVLQEYPYLGPFMAYEIVTDLRHSLLSEAPDIMKWANPGPGATRGLGRIWYYETHAFNRHNKRDYAWMQLAMQELLRASLIDRNWPHVWPKWEMRDVEHTLCEFDKHQRALNDEGRPKQRYNGGP